MLAVVVVCCILVFVRFRRSVVIVVYGLLF